MPEHRNLELRRSARRSSVAEAGAEAGAAPLTSMGGVLFFNSLSKASETAVRGLARPVSKAAAGLELFRGALGMTSPKQQGHETAKKTA